MSTTLTTTQAGGAVAGFGAFDPFAAFGAAARDMGATDVGTFLKFGGNSGEFTFGSSDRPAEVPHGTQLVVDMKSMARGWICWKDGEVVDEVMVDVVDGNPPDEQELPDHGPYTVNTDGSSDGWKQQSKILLRVVSCEDESIQAGKDFIFKPASTSARKGLANLARDFSKLYKQHPGEYPVVEISSSSFFLKDNKKAGKKYAPIFAIVGWVTEDEYNGGGSAGGEDGSDDPSSYAAPAPKAVSAPAAPVSDSARSRKRF